MKRIASTALAALLVGSFAIAADNENSEKATSDTSKNPITGTVTKTKKYNKKVKDSAGNDAKVEVTEKTKTHKDGTKKTTVDAEGEQTTEAHH